jgi:hypothetical protein
MKDDSSIVTPLSPLPVASMDGVVDGAEGLREGAGVRVAAGIVDVIGRSAGGRSDRECERKKGEAKG